MATGADRARLSTEKDPYQMTDDELAIFANGGKLEEPSGK
jgi:hypothetical protein